MLAVLRYRPSALRLDRAGSTAGFSAASGSTVSRLVATLCFVSRFAAISAAAIHVVDGSQSGEPRLAFFSRAMAGQIGAGVRLVRRAPSLLAEKILFDQKSVTGGDRLDRTRLWAPSLPVISPCVQLVALRFQGEQPTLGASKIMVYRLHLYSLTNHGRRLIVSCDFFRLLANYIQNE
ncbi:hypothetical protein [Caballeronia cordobensis]|uniref:hypothetical protein n=1 Tax=Caballeronia cordobensis TaxID=1353886 RepID=UPI0006AD66CA|nr:hypothetical protein [Caballeronia cordobensis]